ncbi:MAG: hypothetical protein ACOYJA_07210 [Christensenellales bacterium]|jgi:hypothetical protein
MLYPKGRQETLDDALFANPTSEYRGAPFWAWNCKLDKDVLIEQIEQMKRMGLGGFHMHSRTGMATDYLSDAFMGMVRACVDKAKDEGMLAWLYDEDRWASGAAGGYVTKDHRYRARYLRVSPFPSDEGTFVAAYGVALDDEGCLRDTARLAEDQPAPEGMTRWEARLVIHADDPWFNNQAYLNTLDPEAVRRFIEVTHERYAQVVGDDFGRTVPAIFTDEPNFSAKGTLSFADEAGAVNTEAMGVVGADAEALAVKIPWTDTLPETYRAAYGEDLMDRLPELFWELPGGRVSQTRYRYHDHVAELFASSFADQVGAWCREHGILLTGHVLEEPTLTSQTTVVGDAMRSYRAFGLPGIDMLCDRREYTTAKQAQSAAHQYGAPGVLSELYGVTNWDFDFRGHKLQGDWQAALGVTVRVHHLNWVSMKGEAKRDYPAAIGHQSPWYEQYPLIEDHFARINTAMTRGTPLVKIGVIHPVESYWLHWGPREQTARVREELDRKFDEFAQWMLFGLMDFDYICESLLPGQCEKGGAPLAVGQMAYQAVVVPGCETLRSTTVERLEAFADAGGQLIFMGNVPALVDAAPSDRVLKLAARAQKIDYEQGALLTALEPLRQLQARDDTGRPCDGLLYQMRQDGQDRYLLLAHGKKPVNPDVVAPERLQIRIAGEWKPTLYDTMTGNIAPIPASYKGGDTAIERTLYAHDSLLLRLSPGRADAAEGAGEPTCACGESTHACGQTYRVRQAVPVTLHEPNALLLDWADQVALDDGPWEAGDELLRADNRMRARLGWPSRMDRFAQPWVVPEEPIRHRFRARFTVNSEIPLVGCQLALEDADAAEVWVNGEKLASPVAGFYVDESIGCRALPDLPAGEQVIEIALPFGKRTNVEWCYLLGDFGVEVAGCDKRITELVDALAFGDWTRQGLPFYCGNLTYHVPVTMPKDGVLSVRLPQYRGALLGVSLDEGAERPLAFAPYRADLPAAAGCHTLHVTVYGSRINGFGQVHDCDAALDWFGPNAWRTEGDSWADEYQLHPMGVLVSPQITPMEKG